MGSAPVKRLSRRPKGPNGGARQSVPLRLCVAGGALGIESYEPLPLDPLVIEDLAWTLPSLRFPIDLSGGVDVFRHHRGELTRLAVRASLARLEAFARPKLREALGRASQPPQLWPISAGVGVGVVGELGVLAFDLIWAPSSGDARWVIANARGTGGVRIAMAHALRIAETLFAGVGERQGRVLSVPAIGRQLCRRLAPALGARAPDAASAGIDRLEIGAEDLTLRMREGAAAPELTLDAVRALELARLTTGADDALARGEAEEARTQYMFALSRAPRHPELVALIAAIDAGHSDRAEAALGLLVDCMPATRFGLTGALLLARIGDAAGARLAVEEAAAAEVFSPIAAGLWHELAAIEPSPSERRHALDRAVACAPGLESARWARFEARVERGDERGALADAESLEAGAAGARERHAVLTRAASALVTRGSSRAAGQLFERALRYVPDDPAATAGLGRALLEAGKPERAIALFERAVELAEADGAIAADALIELAQLLAESGDQPQAIARITQIPSSSPRGLEALALEGRYRAALGDLRGASLAFARLRDACELSSSSARLPRAASWLAEAAEFENRSLGDVAAAERHLASALRLAPRDAKVRRMYRQTAAALAKRERTEPRQE